MNNSYKLCSKCIMDTSDPEIFFNKDGVCNHCTRYDKLKFVRLAKSTDTSHYNKMISRIKNSGKKSEYDCIIGVSGGVDSSYLLYELSKTDVRILAVHFDNGWNSDIAVSNLKGILTKLNIDFYTVVADWEEFKNLQYSFLKSSTPDGEIPTDHAILAVLLQEAAKRKIKYVITGSNFSTESMQVNSWAYGHSDWKYIKSVHKQFAKTPLKTYPHFTLYDLFKFLFINQIKLVGLLNYLPYKRNEAIKILENEFGWINYEKKHEESIYTTFFQSYVLPLKFKINKQRGHLSDMVRAGELTREFALQEIQRSELDSKQNLYDYVLKKMQISEKAFTHIMNTEAKTFKSYPNNFNLIQFMKTLLYLMRKFRVYPK